MPSTKTERPGLTAINLLAAERAAHDALYQVHIDVVDGLLKDPETREALEQTSLALFRALSNAAEREIERRTARRKAATKRKG